jgi:transmembrane sensor
MINKAKSNQMAQRIAEAVAWHMHLHETNLVTTPEFEEWLKQPENAHMWGQAIAVWDFVGAHAREPEAVMARTTALTAVKRAMAQRRGPWSWRRPVFAFAAIGLLVVAGLGGYSWVFGPSDFSTGVGERRVVRLEDGSRISLDSESEVTVRYSKHARELHLIKGQARFDVAHDVERPFSVLAGDQKVVATGTSFNIDLTRPDVAVTLIEGHVVVFDQQESSGPDMLRGPARKVHQVELRRGQELIAARSHAPVIKTADVQEVTAWVSGQVIFSNEALSAVVARVNRYSVTPIVIADPDIANERVSGVFNTGDVPGFLDIVTQMLPLEVSDAQPGKIILKKKRL